MTIEQKEKIEEMYQYSSEEEKGAIERTLAALGYEFMYQNSSEEEKGAIESTLAVLGYEFNEEGKISRIKTQFWM